MDVISLEDGPRCECGEPAEYLCAACETPMCSRHIVVLRFGSNPEDHLEMFVCEKCAA
jgi:hypothetical protein